MLVLATLGSFASAQAVRPKPAPKAEARPKPVENGAQAGPEAVASTLYMVVQVKSDNKLGVDPATYVKNAIVEAREVLNEDAKQRNQPPVCEFEMPDPRAITEAVYREFAAFADQETLASGPAADPAQPTRVRLQPVPTNSSLWAFDLIDDPAAPPSEGAKKLLVLQKLTITRRSGAVNHYEPKRLTEAGPADDLKMVLPGSYVLHLDLKDPPTNYIITAQKITGGESEEIKGTWPESDQYFVIILRDFRGQRKALFETIKAKEPNEKGLRITNPLDDIRLDRDFVLTFASLGVKLQIAPPEFEPGKYLPTMPLVPRRDPKRAWIYFPLSREQAAAEFAKLSSLDGAQVIDAILKSGPSTAEKEPEVEIKPGMSPRWLELTAMPDGQRFRRELTIKDYKGLQSTLPEVWRLQVYEGQSGRAILVGHPDSSRQGGFVVDVPIENWPGEIEKGVKTDARAGKSQDSK